MATIQLIGAIAGLIVALGGLYTALLTPLWKWHNQQISDLIQQRDLSNSRLLAAMDAGGRAQAGFDKALQLLEAQLHRARRYGPA